MNQGKITPLLYIALGISVGLFGFFLILANPFGWKLTLPAFFSGLNHSSLPKGVAPAPTPYLFLPHGLQTYNAQGGSGRSTVTTIVFDPLDPKIDTTQTITATVSSREAVKSVILTINTDNKSTTLPMTMSEGTNLKGIWTVHFPVTDSYEKIYNLSFEIITTLGNKTVQPMLIR